MAVGIRCPGDAMKGTVIKKAGVLLLFLLLVLFLWRCPLRFFFGIACPGCGMTRAMMAALTLDFAAAFAWHPLFVLLPVGVILLVVRTLRFRSFTKAAASLERIAVVCALLLIAVYILRLILSDPVVMPDLSAGLAGRLITKMIA